MRWARSVYTNWTCTRLKSYISLTFLLFTRVHRSRLWVFLSKSKRNLQGKDFLFAWWFKWRRVVLKFNSLYSRCYTIFAYLGKRRFPRQLWEKQSNASLVSLASWVILLWCARGVCDWNGRRTQSERRKAVPKLCTASHVSQKPKGEDHLFLQYADYQWMRLCQGIRDERCDEWMGVLAKRPICFMDH